MTRAAQTYVIDRRNEVFLLGAFFICDECRFPNLATAARQRVDPSLGHDDWVDGKPNQYERPPDFAWKPRHVEGRHFDDVPEHIAAAASEAFSCQSIGAHRAAGAMARAVVEATCKDKGITSGRLVDKLRKLEEAGMVRPLIREAADEVRHFGNDMAHGDLVEDLSAAAAAETLSLMAELLNEVYQVPARISKRRAARESRSSESGS